MRIRAKFRVHLLEKNRGGGTGGLVKLSPVYSTDAEHENKQFWDATPTGEISMWINRDQAFSAFRENAEYYVDFTLAEAPVAAAAER